MSTYAAILVRLLGLLFVSSVLSAQGDYSTHCEPAAPDPIVSDLTDFQLAHRFTMMPAQS